MSAIAHHLKNKDYFYDEHDKAVFVVLNTEECHKDGHKVKFQLVNFATNKHTVKTYSHDHHLVLVNPVTSHYTLSHLEQNDNIVHLSLFDSDMNPANDILLTDSTLVSQLKTMISNLKDGDMSSVQVTVCRIEVPALHRVDDDLELEKIVAITGVDFSHLHDHHHNHHHHA